MLLDQDYETDRSTLKMTHTLTRPENTKIAAWIEQFLQEMY